jgi:hypothetical protein
VSTLVNCRRRESDEISLHQPINRLQAQARDPRCGALETVSVASRNTSVTTPPLPRIDRINWADLSGSVDRDPQTGRRPDPPGRSQGDRGRDAARDTDRLGAAARRLLRVRGQRTRAARFLERLGCGPQARGHRLGDRHLPATNG